MKAVPALELVVARHVRRMVAVDADERDLQMVPQAVASISKHDVRTEPLPREGELDASGCKLFQPRGPGCIGDLDHLDILSAGMEMLANGLVDERKRVVLTRFPV